jgi:hypothetical protein
MEPRSRGRVSSAGVANEKAFLISSSAVDGQPPREAAARGVRGYRPRARESHKFVAVDQSEHVMG